MKQKEKFIEEVKSSDLNPKFKELIIELANANKWDRVKRVLSCSLNAEYSITLDWLYSLIPGQQEIKEYIVKL